MPTYTITDSVSGRRLKVSGDSPPSEEEAAQMFAVSAPALVAGTKAEMSRTRAQNLQKEFGLSDPVEEPARPVKGLGIAIPVPSGVSFKDRAMASFAPTPQDEKAFYERINGQGSVIPISGDKMLVRETDGRGGHIWKLNDPKGVDPGDVMDLAGAAPQIISGIATAAAVLPGPQAGLGQAALASGASAAVSNGIGALQDIAFRAYNDQPINFPEIAKRRSLGAALETATGAVLPLGAALLKNSPAKEATKRFLKEFMAEGKAAGEALKKAGVQAETSLDVADATRALYPTKTTPAEAAQSIAAVLTDVDQTISKVANRQAGQAGQQINRQLASQLPVAVSAEQAGRNAQTAASMVMKSRIAQTDALRDEAFAEINRATAGKGGRFIELKNSQALIDDIENNLLKVARTVKGEDTGLIDQFGRNITTADSQKLVNSPLYAPLLTTLKTLKGSTDVPQQLMAVRNLRSMIGSVSGNADDLFPGMRQGSAKSLYKALSQDIEESVAKYTGPGAQKLKDYNKAYSELVNSSENSEFLSKAIKAPSDGGFRNPEELVEQLAKGGTEDWKAAQNVLPAPVFNDVRRAVMDKLTGSATVNIAGQEVVNVSKLAGAIRELQPSVRSSMVGDTQAKVIDSLGRQLDFLNENKGLFTHRVLPTTQQIDEATAVARSSGVEAANRHIKQALHSAAMRRANMADSLVSQVANGRVKMALEDPTQFFDALVMSGRYSPQYVKRILGKLPQNTQEDMANVAFQRVFDQARDLVRTTADNLSRKSGGVYSEDAIKASVLGSREKMASFEAAVGKDRMEILKNLVKYESALAVEQASKRMNSGKLASLVSVIPYNNLFAARATSMALRSAAGRGVLAESHPKVIKAFSETRKGLSREANLVQLGVTQAGTRPPGYDNYEAMMQPFTPEQQDAIDAYLTGE